MQDLTLLTDRVGLKGVQISRQISREKRSEFGQFLTPAPIARLIARQFGPIAGDVRLLDPGAGVGILTAAFIERVLNDPGPVKSCHITAYEVEPDFIPALQSTLAECCHALESAGISAHFNLVDKDFLTEESKPFSSPLLYRTTDFFTHSILNPPYKKINSSMAVKSALVSAGIHTVNFYSAFVWLAAMLLAERGEISAITPRSFCNGTYYLPFRNYFLQELSLDRIHIFDSREAAFSEDDILQENIIFHAVKRVEKPEFVVITSSVGYANEEGSSKEKYTPYQIVVASDDREKFIHITTDHSEEILHGQMEIFASTLSDLGLQVSTGPIVDFRLKDALRPDSGENNVPLFYPESVKFGRVVWPPEKPRKPIAIEQSIETKKWLVPSGWYVFIKRFSAKEEKRRIVAAACPPTSYSQIGIENHLNFFHSNGKGMHEDLAKGLAAYLNSTFFDHYFRQFSGHTQVNATDLRAIHYPDKEELVKLGSKVKHLTYSQKELDQIVQEVIILMDDTKKAFLAHARIEEALDILKTIRVPKEQQNERSALCLLALADISPGVDWSTARQPLRRITEMMDWFREQYGKNYAPNTRETVRRQTMHQFVQLGLAIENPDKPDRPINSPYWCYQLTDSAMLLLHAYGSETWEEKLNLFALTAPNALQEKHRSLPRISVSLRDRGEIFLTSGGQNELIKQIIEEFCSRFTPGGIVLYVGDAGNKFAFQELEWMQKLGIQLDPHGKMPDLIIYYQEKDWLVLVEAVTSHGPVDLKRHHELRNLFGSSGKGLVFVTAFPSKRGMAGYLDSIAWETEVWVADHPDHLIHFNGERFLGPYANY